MYNVCYCFATCKTWTYGGNFDVIQKIAKNGLMHSVFLSLRIFLLFFMNLILELSIYSVHSLVTLLNF